MSQPSTPNGIATTNQLLTNGSLTQGLLSLAGPMFISAMLQNAQSLIDLFWVGRLGSDAVAALAMSGTLLMMLFPVIMGMATGTVAIVARSTGSGRLDEAADAGAQSLNLAFLSGLVAGGVGWFFAAPLCRLLGGSPTVAALGTQYLRLSFAGSFTVFILFIGNSILQATGNALLPMVAMVLANVVNLVLDPILIFGLLGFPRMEVAGAALATVISQAVAAAVVVVVLARGTGGLRVHLWPPRLQREMMWRLLRVGVPSSGQMLSRSLMGAVLMRVVAAHGTAVVAAYGIGVRFHMIILMPAFTLGNAAATLVGQNLGAGKPDRAAKSAWLATGLDLAIMAVSAAVLMAFAPALIGIFDSSPAVVSVGSTFLRIVSPFYIVAALSVVLGRALQGAGDTMAPMITTIVGLWGFQVPLALILPRWFAVPTDGIWWSSSIALTVNGLMVAAWFATNRWKTRQV